MKILLPLALAATASPALAQSADQFPDRPIARTEVIATVKRQMAAMDANRDGAVTREEFQRFLAHQPAARPGSAEALAHVGAHWFENADANGDGRVTLDEALARPLRLFDLADINHDGVVSVAERDVALTLLRLSGH